MDKIKGFKGFNKNLQCTPAGKTFQFEIGQEYEHKGKVSACNSGFHFCEAPLDVFGYYAPADSRYCEVEGSGQTDGGGADSKVAVSKLKIGAEIGIPGLVRAQIEYVKSRCTTEHTDPEKATAGNYGAATAGDSGAATAGNYGAATAGYRGAATAGDSGAATAGDSGAATAGDSGAATAGDSGAATAGNYGAATAGDSGAATAGDSGAATAGDSGAATAGDSGAATAGNYGAATAGYRGAATAGDSGAATARGSVTVGKDGSGLVRGNGIKIRGGLGAVLVIVNEKAGSCDIAEWKTVVVDGEEIKADTWYRLKDGEVVEADDAQE
ncbi:hypothetical protein Sgly_0315 [Syntrophobotulus glycolicus DSM 8271]|uniref:DUF7666 domain-containing protein n=1 Tax=Syntrophobotulus glycolicus (strain DSM 8271 / FlGlyR) TaxID=645991 RepID=F0SXD6_SYNGF|nr:hypothetical protein [Syntrophobotulus glycolicus]ADY54682.1 hypothetical protein Sgly_0315 [Syntrophobotulus glycolicus DSM 8271]